MQRNSMAKQDCRTRIYAILCQLYMSQRALIIIAWIGIFILAFMLRHQNLEERPLHADEATGARILAQQINGDTYRFNPQHFHGPLLSLSTLPIAHVRGEDSWAELSTTTLRYQSALAGLMLIATPLLWRRTLGNWGTLAAAVLLTTSPLLVYYNRMYIHESLLTLFAMCACAAVFRFSEKPTIRIGVLCGLCLGLMFATKETFAVSVLAWLPAALSCTVLRNPGGGFKQCILNLQPYLIPAALLTLTTAVTAAYFYSDGFRAPQRMIDAVRTYFHYETTEGHEKSANYYLQLLLWPKQQLGLWWCETSVALLALIAVARAAVQPHQLRPIVFLTIAALGHFIIYSSIGYKTPWLMLVPWAHACLLAGYAFSRITQLRVSGRIALTLLLFCGLVYQTSQSIHASGRFSNDSRNPYAYVPTSRDVPRIGRWLQQLTTLPDAPPLIPVAVVGRGYWPLPWYLRSFETIGYWPAPTEALTDFPLIFAMPAHVRACNELLNHTHVALPRALRTNVSITLYVDNNIWENWLRTTEE